MDFASTFDFLTEVGEVGCGFVLLGCFSRVFKFLGMVLIFGFCMKILRFGWHCMDMIHFLCDCGGVPRIRFCLEHGFWRVSKSKIAPLQCEPQKSSSPAQHPNSPIKNNSSTVAKDKAKSHSEDVLEEKDQSDMEVQEEDEVFDILTLRKLVKIERQKANGACAELEEERTAASSSAEEAMAMILRLQSEKSSAEIQANQFRRMAEQKLEYDQEVIESLRWMITQHESQKNLLEDQLEIYREKLSQFMKDEEMNQFEAEGLDASKGFLNFSVEYDPDGGSVVSSSENDSQTL